jgi:hypothetical protein
MYKVNNLILFWIALFIPFPTLGLEVGNKWLITPAILLAVCYVGIYLLSHGLHKLHLYAIGLLTSFVITSIFRHELKSYIFSILALSIAVAPLTAPIKNELERRSLMRGFVVGLYITLGFMFAELIGQVFGLIFVKEFFASIFSSEYSNSFLGIERPKAGFFEPSHLAIYLCFSYIILDVQDKRNKKNHFLRVIVLLSLIFSGSLSGLVLIVGYFIVTYVKKIGRSFLFAIKSNFIQKRTAYQIVAGVLLISLGFVLFSESIVSILGAFGDRLFLVVLALISGDLVGSESSRVNAMSAVFEYWSQQGFVGVLFGTGYANSKDWLISNYGYLGDLSTFARGQQDNLLAAILLSTGLFGLAAYLVFLLAIFKNTKFLASGEVVFFFLLLHFVYGFFVSYLHWYLLFVLLAALRIYKPRGIVANASRHFGRRQLSDYVEFK